MPNELAQRLKDFARHDLGFDLVGVCSATPLSRGHLLAEWIESGSHAEMSYISDTAHIRTDPRRFFPSAQSVVCVALSYHDPFEPPHVTPAGDQVVVARYARRPDYHKVIRRRLVRLGRFLESARPGARWRSAVDTAPMLEKELAERAGLGWVGKNTCLINRVFGSEILLGQLVTDVILPPDPPERDHCGRCSACLDACPTRALPRPYYLEARRCISYLTIEHRSEIAVELGDLLGINLAGCDICQAACPWNHRTSATAAPPLRARPCLCDLRLGGLTELDETGWLRLCRGTPLRRVHYAAFRRNLGIVAANISRAETGARDGPKPCT